MGNNSLGWKIVGLLVSIGLIIGGLSGELVLRGTNSSTALVVVGVLFLIWDIISIATHKKQEIVGEEINVEALPDGTLPVSETSAVDNNWHGDVRKQADGTPVAAFPPPPTLPPPPKYNGFQWFIHSLKHFADFSGRARRQEYWMFTLFNFIFYIAWAIFVSICAIIMDCDEEQLTISFYGYYVLMMLPSLAVAVRRLHDTGKSGWMLLLACIPLVGFWILALMFTEGDQRENKYGPNPKTQLLPLNEKTQLKNVAVTLIVAASFAVFACVMEAIFIEYHSLGQFTRFFSLIAYILTLIAGIFLLSEKNFLNLSDKGKQALLLLLISVLIQLLISLYFMFRNFMYIGLNLYSYINFLFFSSISCFIAYYIYKPQNRQFIQIAALVVLITSGIHILWKVYTILNLGGSNLDMHVLGLLYFMLPVAFILLAWTYLSGKDQPVAAIMPSTSQMRAQEKATGYGSYEKTPYFTLEHQMGSRYHHVGEYQKINAEQVEIGRDPSCGVRFDENFETVSRRHAAIIREGSHWKLVPLSQTNPSFINGQIVQRAWYLQNGDEIQCAVNGPRFVFRTSMNS